MSSSHAVDRSHAAGRIVPQRDYLPTRSSLFIVARGRLLTVFGGYCRAAVRLHRDSADNNLSTRSSNGDSKPDLLVIEAIGNIGFPPRYLNPDGQFRSRRAPYAERDLHGPAETLVVDREEDTSQFSSKMANASRVMW